MGSKVSYGPQVFDVTPGLVFVNVLKQRLEGLPAGAVFAYEFDAAEPDAMKRYTLIWSDDQGFVAPWSSGKKGGALPF